MITFHYADNPPRQWGDLLSALKAQGSSRVHLPIAWGLHEKTRGMRDFNRSSRLHLEKLFAAAGSAGVKLHLSVGFFSHPKVFPEWVLAFPQTSMVPIGIWDEGQRGFSLVSVPQLNDEILEGFGDFLKELSSLLSLYKALEGPIEEVNVCWDLYLHDQNAFTHPQYCEQLQARYQDLKRLNSAYQTAFNSFAAAATAQAFRALWEKRAWLAAYDYKSVRADILSKANAKLIPIAMKATSENIASEWNAVFDDTLVEVSSDVIHPFSPAGYAPAASVQAFQMMPELVSRLKNEGAEIHWLSEEFVPSAKMLVVFAGKYISQKSTTFLQKWVQEGKSLFFPFGRPSYREDLAPFSLSNKTKLTDIGVNGVLQQDSEKGKIFFWKEGSFNPELLKASVDHLLGLPGRQLCQ